MLCWLGIAPLSAQVGSGRISGLVVDSSGSAIVGAKVSLNNLQTNITSVLITNSEGRYSAPNLMIGSYEARAQMEGFRAAVRQGIEVAVGKECLVDFELQVGQVEESLTVSTEIPLVDKASTALGAVIGNQQMRDLPLNGRNFEQMISLAPGVVQVAPQGQGGGNFVGTSPSFSIAGLRPEGQAILLDGADIQGFWDRGSGSTVTATTLGVEAIEEFQVLTNTYSAQFGGFGGVVNAVSRSGTNAFHGSAYEFYRSSKMDARNYFDPPSGPPEFHRSQFGGALGGPLKPEKAFIFLNYEGLRQVLGVTKIAQVPDQNAHAGFLPCNSINPVPVGCDPANPSLVNVGVDPGVGPALALFPLPNSANLGGGIGNYTSTGEQPTNEDYVASRMDVNISNTDSLFVRHVADIASFTTPYAEGPFSGLPGYGSTYNGLNQYLTVGEKKILSSSMVNDFRFHWVRTNQSKTPYATGASVPALNFLGADRPAGEVDIGGLSAPGGGWSFTQTQTRFAAEENLYATRGNHSLKFGLQLMRVHSDNANPVYLGGIYAFDNLQDFLTNHAFSVIGALPGFANSYRRFREFHVYGYAEDSWKLKPHLTLNLGLRYEYMTNPIEANGLTYAVVDPFHDTGFTHVSHAFAHNPATKNFEPRLGFSWSPFGQTTAIHGGFGIFHRLLQSREYSSGYNFAHTYQIGIAFFPSFPNPFAGGAGLAAAPPSVLIGIPYSMDVTPYAMEYNLTIEHQLSRNVVLTVGYIGTRSVYQTNTVALDSVIPSMVLPDGRPFRPSALGPRFNPAFAGIAYLEPISSSHYDALQVSATARSRILQYLLSYTYSNCIDYGSESLTGAGIAGTNALFQQTEPLNFRLDRGPCDFRVRHLFTGSAVYSLPFHGNGFVRGWQLSVIGTARSGFPFSPYVAFDNANQGIIFPQTRPDLVPGRSPNPVIGSPRRWFDPTAFSLPAPGAVGNLGRNTISGPGLIQFDVALSKETSIRSLSESFTLQVRLEAFNVLNHPNFSPPVNAIFTDASGVVNPAAGIVTSTSTTSRQTQIGVKLIF